MDYGGIVSSRKMNSAGTPDGTSIKPSDPPHVSQVQVFTCPVRVCPIGLKLSRSKEVPDST